MQYHKHRIRLVPQKLASLIPARDEEASISEIYEGHETPDVIREWSK